MAPRTQIVARWTSLLLCATGAWISAELVKEHAGPWPSYVSTARSHDGLCGTGRDGESGCAAVLESDWSAIDFNVPALTPALTIQWSRVVVPVAFIGLAYFVFLGIWHAFAGPPRAWGWRWYPVPLLAVLGGAASSVLLVWVMFFKLEAPCRWCLAIHAINGLLLVCTLCLRPSRRSATQRATIGRAETRPSAHERLRLPFGAALRVTGFAGLVIAGLWVYHTAKLEIRQEVGKLLPYKQFVEALEADSDFLLREYHALPQHPIPARPADHELESRLGDAIVVVFSDFSCPHCACFARKWRQEYRRNWDGSLRVTFRHFPLCDHGNETVTDGGDHAACQAAHAAEAARLQGGEHSFWKMHDLLFAHSNRLGSVSYETLAARIGLDGHKLVADMGTAPVRRAVREDVALAAKLGVTGTPAVFLNGRRVPRLCVNNPVFWKAVAADAAPEDRFAASDRADRQPAQDTSAEPVLATAAVQP